MLVALLLYAYARGNRSSRGIERACWEDVAFKVITGMRTPDHSTIAEFRRRHEREIGELFDDVLGLCREAGLVSVGVITIDGTKINADASMDQNRTYRDLVTQILREAEEIDQAEDRRHGKDRRGDELPEELRTAEGRRQALADAKRRLEERKGRAVKECAIGDPEMDLEPLVLGRQVLRRGGRREWPRVARRELEAHRARQAQAIPRDREDRLFKALERFEQNHRVELTAHEDYDRWRASARDTKGRVLRGNSKPFTPPELPDGVINLSDPDEKIKGPVTQSAGNHRDCHGRRGSRVAPHGALSDDCSIGLPATAAPRQSESWLKLVALETAGVRSKHESRLRPPGIVRGLVARCEPGA